MRYFQILKPSKFYRIVWRQYSVVICVNVIVQTLRINIVCYAYDVLNHTVVRKNTFIGVAKPIVFKFVVTIYYALNVLSTYALPALKRWLVEFHIVDNVLASESEVNVILNWCAKPYVADMYKSYKTSLILSKTHCYNFKP